MAADNKRHRQIDLGEPTTWLRPQDHGRRRWKFSRRYNLSVDPYSVGDCFLCDRGRLSASPASIRFIIWRCSLRSSCNNLPDLGRRLGESGRARLLSGLDSCRSSLRGLLRCRPGSGYWQCCPPVSLRCLGSPTSFRSQSTILLKHRRSRPNREANSVLAELSLYSLNSLPCRRLNFTHVRKSGL